MYTAQGKLVKDSNNSNISNVINNSRNIMDRNELAKKYFPLVNKQAIMLHRKINYNVELNDLIQSGMIGLLDALEKYKDQGVQFETYAQTRIYGSMIDNIRQMDTICQEDRALLKKIEIAKQECIKTHGENYSDNSIAEKCDISNEKYYALLQLKNATKLLTNDDETTRLLIEGIVDDNQNVEQRSIKKQLIELLCHEIDSLEEREGQVMALYYQEELTLKEIAKVLNLTEARVSQIHNKIIGVLKAKMTQYSK